MKYRGDVPAAKQIRMRDFKLLPGVRVKVKLRGEKEFREAEVIKVVFANPEYVLWEINGVRGKKPKDAGLIVFDSYQRKDCKDFLARHRNAKIRLQKSMWAVLEFTATIGKSDCRGNRWTEEEQRQTILYTYDIEKMIKSVTLQIVEKF